MKKRTKKAIILFLSIASVVSVIGCGKKEEAKKTESDAKKSNTEETAKTTDSSASLPEIGEDGSFTSSDGKITMTLDRKSTRLNSSHT